MLVLSYDGLTIDTSGCDDDDTTDFKCTLCGQDLLNTRTTIEQIFSTQ